MNTVRHNLETHFFNVFYNDVDCGNIVSIVSTIDETYQSIIERFSLEVPPEKLRLIFCIDSNDFLEQSGLPEEYYQPWIVGQADSKNNKLCVISPNTVKDRSFEDMVKVIKHEIVHIAFGQVAYGYDVSLWLAEGTAVALSGQVYDNKLNDKCFPDVHKISDGQYFCDNNGYPYSGAYVLHLLKMIGNAEFKRVYAGESELEQYLYDGFEKEAIVSLNKQIK